MIIHSEPLWLPIISAAYHCNSINATVTAKSTKEGCAPLYPSAQTRPPWQRRRRKELAHSDETDGNTSSRSIPSLDLLFATIQARAPPSPFMAAARAPPIRMPTTTK